MQLSGDYNQKSEITVKPKINIAVNDEINAGVSMKSDTKTLQECFPQFVYNPKDCKGLYWLRGDVTRSLAMAGCDQKLADYINHSFEVVFGWKDFKGIKDHPVALRAGFAYELSDQTTYNVQAEAGQSYSFSTEVEHQVDSHWTVSATQSFDASNVGSKVSPYHVGFSAAYKL